MWLVLLKDTDGDEVFEVVSAEDEDEAYEQAEKLNKGSKATGIKLLVDKDGKNTMFKRGGKVKGRKTKYTYLPQHEIAYITTWDGVIIDAEDILDGAYIRGRRKFEEGGQVWSGSSEGVEGAGMFAKGGKVRNWKKTKNGVEYELVVLNSPFGKYGYKIKNSIGTNVVNEMLSDEEIEGLVLTKKDDKYYLQWLDFNNKSHLKAFSTKEELIQYKNNLKEQGVKRISHDVYAKGGSITENPYKYAKDKAQGLVSKAKEVSGFAKGGGVGSVLVTEYASQEDYKKNDNIKEFSFNTFEEADNFARTEKAKGRKFVVFNIPTRQQFYYGLKEIEYAKGGRVKRSKGNSPSGRAWTLDHYQHNKREDYEVPMRDRKHKR